jgi:alkanesulfonate monooxygenase SsuD/methylene tetrahydromethanopterin reductase-like flavin-dependent oxidoreductase (luciferase family)
VLADAEEQGMRLGLRLRDDRLPFSDLIALARLAEARGFEALFVPEASGREVFTQLAVYACHTARIRLSPGIATIFTRTPSLLAQAAATLDQLSGGRAMLGLGSGHAPTLTAGHGVHFERPLARMREYVTLIKAILRGAETMPPARLVPVTRFRLETSARPDIPIYMAALGPKMCQHAGELADGVLLNWAMPAYVAQALHHVRLGAERAGCDPATVDVACYIRVAAGADDEILRHAVARELARYIAMPFYRAMFDEAGFAAHTGPVAAAYPEDPDRAARLVPDAMLEALTVIGDAAAARRRLEEFRAMGVRLPVLAPVPAGPDDAASWRAAIELAPAAV